MILKANDKEYALTYKARQMIEVGEQIGGQYELETGAYKGDLKILARLLSIFCDSLTYETALDVIDELLDSGKTVKDIYSEIFEDMNKKAFFTNPLQVQDVPPIDLQEYMQKMMDDVGVEMSKQAKTEVLKSM